MRRTIIGVALAILTMGLLVPGSPAHATTASPTLTIDTPGPLADLAPVTMTGRGLMPGDTLFFMECQSYGDLCTYASGVSGTVDAHGDLRLAATAHRYIHDYMDIPPPIDCAYEDCGFAFVRRGDYEDGYLVVAETVGHFARVQASPFSASIEAPAPLPAVVSTRVLGHGFTPGTEVHASRCHETDPDANGRSDESCLQQEAAIVDGHGDVVVPIELRRVSVDGTVDCVDPVRICSVRLDGPDDGQTARVALVFDGHSVPPPPPTITLSPQPLRHVDDTVTVTGHGFRPDHVVTISGPGPFATATADANGSFTAPLEVQRYVMSPSNLGSDPVVDCATAGACVVTATTGPDDAPAHAPVRFATHSDDPTLLLDGATVNEGDGVGTASFRVHLDRPAAVPVDFWYSAGFDGQDPDLHVAFGTEEIPAGTTDLVVPFQVYGDRLDEPDHHTSFTVVELTGAQLAQTPSIPITILDDDRRPHVDIGDAIVSEDAGHATVPVRLDAISGRTVTVEYVTHHDTARSGRDFVRSTGTVTIAAGSHIGHIRIPIVDDTRAERPERFTVELRDPHNGVIRDGAGFVWIGDDD